MDPIKLHKINDRNKYIINLHTRGFSDKDIANRLGIHIRSLAHYRLKLGLKANPGLD